MTLRLELSKRLSWRSLGGLADLDIRDVLIGPIDPQESIGEWVFPDLRLGLDHRGYLSLHAVARCGRNSGRALVISHQTSNTASLPDSGWWLRGQAVGPPSGAARD
jgi:hypothetical protein